MTISKKDQHRAVHFLWTARYHTNKMDLFGTGPMASTRERERTDPYLWENRSDKDWNKYKREAVDT